MIFPIEDQAQRLKWAFSSCKNGAWGAEPDGEHDVICIRAADFNGQLGQLNKGERTLRSIDRDTFGKISLRPGDIVLEKSGGGEKQLVGRAVIFDSDEPSITSNFLARCRPAEGIEPAYLNYLLLAIYNGRGAFPHIKQSIGIQNLDLGSFLNIRVRIPPLDTQRRIARFLDDKTSCIDALIEKKRALLDRLAEKRQALITRAVTKGLNPNAPVKSSGIDWLGDVPTHWEILPLRRIARKVTTGRTPPSTYTDYFADGTVNWFTPGDFGVGIELDVSARKITPEAIKDGVATLFPADTILLVGIGATLGKVAVITVDGSANQQINAILCEGRNDPYFFTYFLHGFRKEVRVTSNGNTLGILNQDGTKSLTVPIPPATEQREISRILREYDDRVTVVMLKVEHSIDHLQDYRAATITSAVTGRLTELL